MLSGNNSILEQATRAKTKNTNANVLEQIQLEASAYTIDKNTGVYSNSLIDYLKSKSIISDISGEEDKWLINVTTLLGSNQPKGNGTYPNDVYVLEKQDTSTGSIVNTKVATTMPIKIAATNTSQITYTVKYYENANNEKLILGNLFDNDTQVEVDESEKLKAYFNSPDSRDGNGNFIDNNTVGIKANDLFKIALIENQDNVTEYILYHNSVYKCNDTSVSKIDSNFNLNKFGEYAVDGINILVDSNQCTYQKQDAYSVGQLDWGYYMVISGSPYYYTIEEKPDYNRPFIGYIAKKYDVVNDIYEIIYYDINGNIVENIIDTRPV